MTRPATKADPAQASIFDSGARARSRDPETSKAAAASVRNVRASHTRVLAMFRLYGDMTDESLAALLKDAARETGLKAMSPSGVRSRRSELAKPNMDRLDSLALELWSNDDKASPRRPFFSELNEYEQRLTREQLRREGFRSPLWDTGKRETLASGRQAIVWGVAR
jgi:hypothetical protein